MIAERWDEVQELFLQLVEQAPEVRALRLGILAENDPDLHVQVKRLLAAHDEKDELLGNFEELISQPLFEAPSTPAEEPATADPHEALHESLAEKYELEEVLGEGGMGTVYLARDLKHDRPVAIKTIHPDRTNEEVRRRFEREIRITSHLQHPHILPLLDSGVAGGVLYYVMPYIEGESLRERLDHEGRLPLEEALRIARQVANGLGYAHGHGVVHRDIKPGNIMLTTGEAVLTDFGIARAITEAAGEHLTQPGLTFGSPAYMSPEHVSEGEVDGRSDIYSLGCVVYEMLAGEPPFMGSTPLETIARSVREEATPLRSKVEGVPPDVEGAVHKALAKKPKDRYETGEALAEALAEALTGGREAAAVRPLTPARTSRRWWRIGTAVRSILPRVGAPERGLDQDAGAATDVSSSRIAVFPFSVRGAAEIGYLGEGMVDLLSTKLDGAGELRSVDARALLAALEGAVPDIQRARQVARRYGAGLVVLGNIVEVSGRLQLSASVYDLRVGPGERIARIAAVTTSSVPALKDYLTGEQAFRAGDFDVALESFRRATERDTSFALAYYRLSLAAEWSLGDADLVRSAAIEAARRSHRLSEHDGLLLKAFVADRRGDAEEAERLYRGILAAYPEDVEAWFQLGEVLFHYGPLRGRSLAASKSAWERVLELEPGDVNARIHLARIAAQAGELEELDEVVAAVLSLSRGERNLEMRALQAYAADDSAAQQSVLADARRADFTLLTTVTWSETVVGSGNGASDLLAVMMDPGQPAEGQALGHVWAAHWELGRGRWSEARQHLIAAEALSPGPGLEYRSLLSVAPFVSVSEEERRELLSRLGSWDPSLMPPPSLPNAWFTADEGPHAHLRLYLMGLLELEMEQVEATLASADQLEQLPLVGEADADLFEETLPAELASTLRGMAAFERGDFEEAVALLEASTTIVWYIQSSASGFHAKVHARWARAEALAEIGRTEEALRWYGSFGEHTLYDLPYQAPAHYEMGRLLEAAGDSSAAAGHFRRFIEMWSDADQEFQPLLLEVSERLSLLGQDR
jgi:tetratricopeptide (TPR) repeat protein/predicted Ser/Thr protein kinase